MPAGPDERAAKRKLYLYSVSLISILLIFVTAAFWSDDRADQLLIVFIGGLTFLISERAVERILRFTPPYKTPLGGPGIAVFPGMYIVGFDLMGGSWWTTAIAAAISIVAGFVLWPERGRWFAKSRPWVRSLYALFFSFSSGLTVIGIAGFAWWSLYAVGPQPQPAGILHSLPAPSPAVIANGQALAEFAKRVGAEVRTDTFFDQREPDSIPIAEARARCSAWNDTLATWLVLVEQPEIGLPEWQTGQHLLSGSIHPANLLTLRVRLLIADGDRNGAGELATRLIAAGINLRRTTWDWYQYYIANAIADAGLDGARLWLAATAGTNSRHAKLEGEVERLLREAETGYREAVISHYRENAESFSDSSVTAAGAEDDDPVRPSQLWLLYDPIREEIYQENQYWSFMELAALPFPLAAREQVRLQAEEKRHRSFPNALFWRNPTNILPNFMRFASTIREFGILTRREIVRGRARAVQLAFALRAGNGREISTDNSKNPLTGEPLRVDTAARRVIVDCPDIPELFRAGQAGKELWSVRW